jgi:hypothetical protein
MNEGEGEEGEDRLPLGRTGQPLNLDVDAPSEVMRKKRREGRREGTKGTQGNSRVLLRSTFAFLSGSRFPSFSIPPPLLPPPSTPPTAFLCGD